MIHTIVACHNRRDLTRSALASLIAAAERLGIDFDVTLFDDGSTDGTAEAARSVLSPARLRVIRGDGNAFWARGMAEAERLVLSDARDEDLLLWLNDDVVLDEEALVTMSEALDDRDDRVVVGATVDPRTSELNYGGYVRSGPHPLRLRHVPADGRVRPVFTLNGNCVLVPVRAARRVGGIDGEFSHALADIDYGMRVRTAGCELVQAAHPVGTCPSHDPMPTRPILTEYRDFVSVKGGGHPASMIRILRRASPLSWPVFTVWSYGSWTVKALVRSLRAAR